MRHIPSGILVLLTIVVLTGCTSKPQSTNLNQKENVEAQKR